MKTKKVMIATIIEQIRRLFQIFNEESKQEEKRTGLTSPQLWAIKVLRESSPLSVSDLARRMYLHPATVVGILHRLESRALVKRSVSSEDRRVVLVGLTEAGESLLSRAGSSFPGFPVSGLERLPAKVLADMEREMILLARACDAQRIVTPAHEPVGRQSQRRKKGTGI